MSDDKQQQKKLEYIKNHYVGGAIASAIVDGVACTSLAWLFSKCVQIQPSTCAFPLVFGLSSVASGLLEHHNYVNTLTRYSDEPGRIDRDYDMIKRDLTLAPCYGSLGVAAAIVLNLSK